jgi:hypothetical protein
MKKNFFDLFKELYKNEKTNLQILCLVRKVFEQLALDWDDYIQDNKGEPPESRRSLDVIMQAIEKSIGKTNELIYKVEHPEK